MKTYGKYWNSQYARYYYIRDDIRHFYPMIIRSEWTIKNLGMLLTMWPTQLRNLVKKKYNILDQK